MRLRNIGGLIIGDFIDMKSRRDQQAVFMRMKDRLKRDKAKTHVLPISQLGLMEMTRQRAQESLSGSVYESCPYCNGRGRVKTSMTMSVEIQRELHAVMRKYQDTVHDIRVTVNPHVLQRLREQDEDLLIEIERKYAGRLTFRSDPAFPSRAIRHRRREHRAGAEAIGGLDSSPCGAILVECSTGRHVMRWNARRNGLVGHGCFVERGCRFRRFSRTWKPGRESLILSNGFPV